MLGNIYAKFTRSFMKNKIRVKDKKPTRKMEERNMKNRILVACLLSAMCLGLTGCKSKVKQTNKSLFNR